MPRVIWKGAISFGLVHIPVALYPASQEIGINFDWLDKRSMDPVGYKRINKRTGKEIDSENIVRGIKQDTGDYVILSDDEIKAAYPQSTQTIEIEAFVKAEEISFPYLEKPYFLAPIGKGEKVYALLREAMRDAGVIGIARVVMHTKERLAALMPLEDSLMLNTIRWNGELRSTEGLSFPAKGKSGPGLKDSELRMAKQLVGDMTEEWHPEKYADQFTAAVRELAASRLEAGETAQVTPLEEGGGSAAPSNVVDLTDLLKRSLGSRGGKAAAPAAESEDEGEGEDADSAADSKPARKAAAKQAAKSAAPAKKAPKADSKTASASTKTSTRKRAA